MYYYCYYHHYRYFCFSDSGSNTQRREGICQEVNCRSKCVPCHRSHSTEIKLLRHKVGPQFLSFTVAQFSPTPSLNISKCFVLDGAHRVQIVGLVAALHQFALTEGRLVFFLFQPLLISICRLGIIIKANRSCLYIL